MDFDGTKVAPFYLPSLSVINDVHSTTMDRVESELDGHDLSSHIDCFKGSVRQASLDKAY